MGLKLQVAIKVMPKSFLLLSVEIGYVIHLNKSNIACVKYNSPKLMCLHLEKFKNDNHSSHHLHRESTSCCKVAQSFGQLTE